MVVQVGSYTNKQSDKRIVLEGTDFVKSSIAKSFEDIKNAKNLEVAIILQVMGNRMEQIVLCLVKVHYQDILN